MINSERFTALTEEEALYYNGGANGWMIAAGVVALAGSACTGNVCGMAAGAVTVVAGIVY